jgi:hypothetical protein
MSSNRVRSSVLGGILCFVTIHWASNPIDSRGLCPWENTRRWISLLASVSSPRTGGVLFHTLYTSSWPNEKTWNLVSPVYFIFFRLGFTGSTFLFHRTKLISLCIKNTHCWPSPARQAPERWHVHLFIWHAAVIVALCAESRSWLNLLQGEIQSKVS